MSPRPTPRHPWQGTPDTWEQHKREINGAPKHWHKPTSCQESQVAESPPPAPDMRKRQTSPPCAPFSLDLTLEVGGGQSYRDQLHALERQVLEATLSACAGSVVATARSLRLPRQSVYDMVFRHALDPADYRPRKDSEQ